MAEHPKDWSDLAISLYDKLTGRNAEITYEFKDFQIDVPSGPGAKAEHARWGVSGSLVIRARDMKPAAK